MTSSDDFVLVIAAALTYKDFEPGIAMYSSNHPIPPPPHHFEQQAPATGIPITSINQQYPTQHNIQPARKGPWSTGLCDCCSDVTNCCITCWCPCITFGRIAEIVDHGSTTCGASGALYGLLCWFTGCGCIYSCFYRSRLRREYMLAASPCGDCCVHFCCETCALCQEYRELKNRGFDMSLGWHGNMERQQNRGVPLAVPSAPVMETGMKR